MKFALRFLGVFLMSVVMMSAAMAGEGRVISFIDSAGYTYLEVDQEGKIIWIAANEIKVKSGERVRFDEGMLMTNFHSDSLKRTFDSMRFVNQILVIDKP